MLGRNRTKLACRLLPALLPFALIAASASAESAGSDRSSDPMQFFEGRTESLSTIRVMMRKPYRSLTLGDGKIDDGVLHLVQRVHEDGKAPYERSWRVRQLAPGRFTATMS